MRWGRGCLRFGHYTGKYGSRKTRILACFTQSSKGKNILNFNAMLWEMSRKASLTRKLLLSMVFQRTPYRPAINDKSCETRTPSPLIQCWLQIGCSFLVFTALHDFFRLGATLSQWEGGFWVTLSNSNVFLWTFLWKYRKSQLFLSLIVGEK